MFAIVCHGVCCFVCEPDLPQGEVRTTAYSISFTAPGGPPGPHDARTQSTVLFSNSRGSGVGAEVTGLINLHARYLHL